MADRDERLAEILTLLSLYGRSVGREYLREQGIDIDEAMDIWAAEHAPRLLDQLYSTTRSDIIRTLDGKPVEERAAAIALLFAGYAATRRPKIAETEANVLLNRVYLEAAKALGRDTKSWITRLDERVRSTHAALHGVVREIGEPFVSSSGDKAMAPGGFATAAENVNCRCRLHTGGEMSEEQQATLLADHDASVDRSAARMAQVIAPLFANMEILAVSAAAAKVGA